MLLSFTLSMPTANSWNGKWSCEDRLYCIVRSFRGDKAVANATRILEKGSFYYRWSDGWRACVSVEQVDANGAARLRKKSDGFAGYDWMVDTIIQYGKPMAEHEVKEFLKTKESVSATD